MMPLTRIKVERVINYTDTADEGADYLCSISADVIAGYGYVKDVYYTDAAMEETEIIDLEELMEATRKEYCQYIVINPTRQVKGDPEELGLQFLADIDGYRVYLDPVAAAQVESWQQYYEED